MTKTLLTALLLTACGADDPTATTTEHTCESFINDPTYVYAGGKTTIDITGIEDVAMLGPIVLFVPPGGMASNDDRPTMVEPGRWSVLAVSWNGQIGRAVQLFNRGHCAAVWVERL